MGNRIELRSINDLMGMNFFIPNYQRGYRWGEQQVTDLLTDIQEFISKDENGFYCIQPLVVKVREQETHNLLKGSWEVIDGQQRLTTIYILLSCLGKNDTYTIEYETREDSRSFLENINESENEMNIDYFYMVEAKKAITDWLCENKNIEEEKFLSALLNKVKFIWYESSENDPIKVFNRLNVGKISLTNAELIKALFLNKSNFPNDDNSTVRLHQQEIALEWDTIEYTLQNDEFWLFINSANYDRPTRIDLLFDLLAKRNSLELDEEELKNIGSDEYMTFRYFYTWFQRNRSEPKNIRDCWQNVKQYFQIFQEWYNDLEFYHYIGYLLCLPDSKTNILEDLTKEWENSKQKGDYIKVLIAKITGTLESCKDLNKQYEVKSSPKTQCRPILLLHNIQTIVNQNKNLKDNEKYKLPVFYKFPFHLFKKEKWDVEHIDSSSENSLENPVTQKEWLRCSLLGIEDEGIKSRIHTYLNAGKNVGENDFDLLYNEITDHSRKSGAEDTRLADEDKDKLWNFTLLDSSTNRSYGNSIFPAKRRIIIGKDQGIKYNVSETLEITEERGIIAFVPPCTKNVFLKYFNHSTNGLREWDKQDAKAYLENIKQVLSDFLPKQEEK